MVELILDEAPDLHVLVQQVGVVLRREPARAPGACRAEPKSHRVRLLAPRLFFLLWLSASPSTWSRPVAPPCRRGAWGPPRPSRPRASREAPGPAPEARA